MCERCGVEVTESKVRRHRMGYIELAAPVTHVWYLKGTTSYLGLLLDLNVKEIEKIVYFHSYVVIDAGESTKLYNKQLLEGYEWKSLEDKLYKEFASTSGIEVSIGAEAIKKLLDSMDLEELAIALREEALNPPSNLSPKFNKKMRRLRLIENFISTGAEPSWMVLSCIPVIPPDLRPMVQLDGGRFATADLNEFYRRIINRNNRLIKLKNILAPEIIIRNEKRMLQEAVDSLMDNGCDLFLSKKLV